MLRETAAAVAVVGELGDQQEVVVTEGVVEPLEAASHPLDGLPQSFPSPEVPPSLSRPSRPAFVYFVRNRYFAMVSLLSDGGWFKRRLRSLGSDRAALRMAGSI